MTSRVAAEPGDAATGALEAARVDVEARRERGERIVFTNGCFDLLHPGHVDSLRRSRSLGDCLLVGVNSDESVRALKGDERPFVPLPERLEMLRALRTVDHAIPFAEMTPERLLRALRPDVYTKGADWRDRELPERHVLDEIGVRVEFIDLLPGFSTTTLVARIRGAAD